MRSRRTTALSIVVTIVALLTALAPPAIAADLSESKGFRKAVTLAGIREHQAVWQEISDENGGNRVGGSVAYDLSRDYVVERMEAAGYDVSLHEFEFVFNADATPPTLRQESPMTFSGNIAATTAAVWAVDLALPQAPGPGATTSGCEAADFAGMPAGSIALMQRGTCTFGAKTDNAEFPDRPDWFPYFKLEFVLVP